MVSLSLGGVFVGCAGGVGCVVGVGGVWCGPVVSIGLCGLRRSSSSLVVSSGLRGLPQSPVVFGGLRGSP